ncbi:MAG TPA: phage holin family protein [Candidatus Binataceae bacterium]|nr:phage holin family protein [Candidatus Binataceae bacterium]
MAQNQIIPRSEKQSGGDQPDWTTLLARAIDDITRIMQSEIRLVTNSMRTILAEQTDRVLGFIASGVLMVFGMMCILAAAILFLHEYAMLPWWQSFGITGLALLAIAIAVRAFSMPRSKTSAIT